MGELSNVDQKRVTRRGLRGGVEDRWKRKDGQPSARAGTGKRWLARYSTPTDGERSKSFAKKTDAETWLKNEMAGVVRGDGVDPRTAKTTVGDVAEVWRAGLSSRTVSTRTTYEHLLVAYVLPRWENVALATIRHADVVHWVADLSAGKAPSVRTVKAVPEELKEGRGKVLAPSTVRQVYKIFAQILSLAVRNRQLAGNPCDHVPLPRVTRSDPRFLTADEVDRLSDAANYLASLPKRPGVRSSNPADALERDDHGKVIIPTAPMSESGLIVLLLAYSGLRAGELFGLQIRRVDLQRARLNVVAAVVEVGGSVVVGEPKTHQVRAVSIDGSFVPLLRDQMRGKAATDYVFADRDGGPVRLRNWSSRVFVPACKLAGITDVTVHDLRHTAASLAVSESVDGRLNIKAIQQMLGHSSAAMTLDVYAALMPDDAKPITRRPR